MAIVLSILDQNGAKSPKMHQKANLSGIKINLSEVFCVNEMIFFEKCYLQLNPSSAPNAFFRHKECNQNPQHVPKVPFNKDLNRNTPSRAVLGGVFCVRGDAFNSYDVSSMAVSYI
jgi:hypothetical protein